MAGVGNFVSNNHVVAMDVHSKSSDSCFSAQVDALLTTEASDGLEVTPKLSQIGLLTPSGPPPRSVSRRHTREQCSLHG